MSFNVAQSDTITFWMGPRITVLLSASPCVSLCLSVSPYVATEGSRSTDHVASTESINIHASPVTPEYEPNNQTKDARVLYMRNIMQNICHGELKMEAPHSDNSATMVDPTLSKFALDTAVFLDITVTPLPTQRCPNPWHVSVCHTFGRSSPL